MCWTQHIDLCFALFPWARFRETKAAAKLYDLHKAQAFFVIQAKSNLQLERLYSHRIDKTTGLRCDQTIKLTDLCQSARKFFQVSASKSFQLRMQVRGAERPFCAV